MLCILKREPKYNSKGVKLDYMFVYCSIWQKYAWKKAEDIISGKFIDGERFEKLGIWDLPTWEDFWNQFQWKKRDFEGSPYYRANYKGKKTEAHKVIGQELFGKKVVYPLCVDHENGDLFQNHPTNLQVIFHFENQEKGKNFKGGVYKLPSGRYKTYFRGKYLGTRDTWMEAKAVREKAIQLYLAQHPVECNMKEEYNRIIEEYLRRIKKHAEKHGNKQAFELVGDEL